MRLTLSKFLYWDSIVRNLTLAGDSGWPNRANETQEEIFRRILRTQSATVFGEKYTVVPAMSYEEFRAAVPVSSYEALLPYIERTIAGEKDVLVRGTVSDFAKSSGTTASRSKFIPTPRAYMKGNHLKAGRCLIRAYVRSNPDTEITSGKSIGVVGSVAEIPDSPSRAGDISALIMLALPWWTSYTRPYSKRLALHDSWPHKAKEIAEKTYRAPVVSLFGTPTWMLEILELVKARSGKQTIHESWPDLEVFFHGAVPFMPYRKTFESLVGTPGIAFREAYNASEGYFAFEDDADAHPGELLLCTDHDIFYEFIRVEDCTPTGEAVLLKDVQKDVAYAMVITTTSGLWRYLVGDVIVFKSTSPYRLQIVGRTTQFLNAFGEEVIADNALKALEEIAKIAGVEVAGFTASPTFDAKPSQGAHEWAIEFKNAPKDISAFTKALDEALKKRNSDYEAKRTEDIVLGAPIVHVVPEGTFRRYLGEKGKLGAQNKVPMLSNDRAALDDVLRIAATPVEKPAVVVSAVAECASVSPTKSLLPSAASSLAAKFVASVQSAFLGKDAPKELPAPDETEEREIVSQSLELPEK